MTTVQNTAKKKDFKLLTLVGSVGVVILFICILISLIFLVLEILNNRSGVYDLQRIGSWGDAFGGFLNPIFSFLALIGLLWTIKYQAEQLLISSEALSHSSSELSLTREELQLTRSELSGSREATQAVARAADRQNIENAFFQMLNLLKDIVENSEIRDQKGTRAFQTIANDHLVNLTHLHTSARRKDSTKKQRIDVANEIFEKTYSNNAAILGHYFRVLYSTLRFLSDKQEEIGSDMFPTYVKILRGNLSDFELIILFYNCLSERGEAMEKYACEFGLFDNIDATHFYRNKKLIWDYRDFLTFIHSDALGESREDILKFASSN